MLLPTALFAAALALAPYDDPHFTLKVPKGWKVTVDWEHGKAVLQENPSEPAGSVIVLAGAARPPDVGEHALWLAATPEGGHLRVSPNTDYPGDLCGVFDTAVRGVPRVIATWIRAEPDLAVVGALSAAPKAFASFDAVATLEAVTRSYEPKGERPKPSWSSDPDKKLMAPELLWRMRGGVTREDLVGTWGWARGITMKHVDYDDQYLERYHTTESGESFLYTFTKDGKYELTSVSQVNSGQGGNTIHETGRWSLEGATLTLTPAHAHQFAFFGNIKKTYDDPKPPPRKVEVWTALAHNLFDRTESRGGTIHLVDAHPNGALVLQDPCDVYVAKDYCYMQKSSGGFIVQREK